MSNIDIELSNLGFDRESYEALLKECADKYEGNIFESWADIVDSYDLPLSPDSVRKAQTLKLLGGYFVRKYYLDKYKDFQDLGETQHRIKMEKQKLSDERTALNKQLRERARLEQDLSYLEDCIRKQGKIYFPNSIRNSVNKFSNKSLENNPNDSMIICLSDLHLGLNTDNGLGTYNIQVATEYLRNYIKHILNIKDTHNCSSAYVVLLGDLVSGNIHQTVQLQNRENIIEQAQAAAELISFFVYELSLYFDDVKVTGVAGNHSRLGFKDQVLRNERIDNIIPWYMKASLSHVKNVQFTDDKNLDDTIACFEIDGKEYWAVHGDYDSFNEKGVSKLVMMFGRKPEGILYGHLHSCSMHEIAGVKIIRSGSFCGTSDDFCITKRISGISSQMIVIVNDDGVKCTYPVNLEIPA